MITQIDEKLIKQIVDSRKLAPEHEELEHEYATFETEQENMDILQKAYDYWCAFYNLRKERKRNIRYKNGDQWSDMVEDPDHKGRIICEEELISRSGRLPLKHNIIAQIIRNLLGQHLANPTQSVIFARNEQDANLGEMMTNALAACHHINNTSKLDIAFLEELIIAGIGCMKVRYDYIHEINRSDGKIEPVNINRLFFNSDIEDPRFFDLNFIGQLHEYTIDEIVSSFAHDKAQEVKLREIFSPLASSPLAKEFASSSENINFFTPENGAKYRIVEIWQREGRWVNYIHDPLDATHELTTLTKEEIDQINKERKTAARKVGGTGSEVPLIEFIEKYEYYWSVRFIDTNGHTLHKGISPFAHESHPYVLGVMPMVDGEFRSYLSDLIDMQRYVNRLIMMIDFIMGNSAKGVLMLPEDCIPEGYSVEDFAQEYVKANGIIVYRPNNRGSVPSQITSNSNPASAWSMLQMQLNLIDKVSGVTEAMQGRGVNSSTPASLYAQQVSNSQLNYRIIFETFNSFIKQRDEKLMKTLMQFYTEKRLIDIAGLENHKSDKYWDPVEVGKITNFNLVVSSSFETPTYLMQIEDQLMLMLRNRYIDFNTFLKNSSMPYAKRLLNQIEGIELQSRENAQKPPLQESDESIELDEELQQFIDKNLQEEITKITEN
ncbi:MAG: hypothetical protein R3Y04_03715 [Rikenellaceae bacterium]